MSRFPLEVPVPSDSKPTPAVHRSNAGSSDAASRKHGADAIAVDAAHPVIARFGTIAPLPQAAGQPDPSLDYKVVFALRHAAEDPATLHPSLDRLARLLNLLGSGAVRIRPGHVIGVLQGKALPLALDDASHRARHGCANPNLELIDALAAAGVQLHACGQALHAQGIAPGQLAATVQVDLSAMTTMATLQLQGWALLTD